jgi:hypothetical protein
MPDSTTAPPSAAEASSPPSLGNLPPELKAIIVEMVDQVDEEDEEDMYDDIEEVDDDGNETGAHEHEHGEDCAHDHDPAHSNAHAHEHVHGEGCSHDHEDVPAEPSSMSNLSLVNKEFASLAQPFLWKVSFCSSVPSWNVALTEWDLQHVDFTYRSTEQVLHFIQEILPRHADHIQGLQFSQNEVRLDEPGANQVIHLLNEEHISAAEELAEVSKAESPLIARHSRARGLLFASIIPRLPNLDTLDFDFHYLTSVVEDIPLPVDHVVEAALKVGSKITDLTLTNELSSMRDEAYLASLLSHFPNLLRLDLALGALHSGGRDDLIKALVGLSKLETMSLMSAPYVTDDFAAANWVAPLKILALSSCEDLSFAGFRTLVDKFSSTLTVLDLDDVPHNNSEKDNKKYLGLPFDLPKLNTLVLTTLHPASFLDSFAACSLVEFSFGFCPNIPYAAVEAFVVHHSATLKEVTLEDAANLSSAQIESLEVLCHAKGINCTVDAPDSDMDSGMDEEDEWGSEDEDAMYETGEEDEE